MEFPEDVLARVQEFKGMTSEPISFEVTFGDIKRFAHAIGDDSPLYLDPEYALQSSWHGVVAPPTFVCSLRADLPLPDVQFGTVNLNGGNSFEFRYPIRPGDVITAITRLEDVKGSVGKTGLLLILTRVTRYTNQHNRLVAVLQSVTIRR